ncbi:MAG TPA: MFS transporter [Clostridiaceae bacterium]|nr:MFS transporter [Clostridiaceae bacterium]
MGIIIRKEYYKFKIFMFIYWLMMVSTVGMYTMYIADAGFSKKEISIAVSIFTFSTFIGRNLIGYLADRFKSVKKILFISIIIGAIATIALLFSKDRWVINIIILLWGIFFNGSVPLSEAWYIEVLKENGDQNKFGTIRGFGSIGYSLSAILLGLLLEKFGWDIYAWYILISVCFLLLSILWIAESKEVKFYKAAGGKRDKGDVSVKEGLAQIIKIRPLMYILIILFMYFFVVKGIYVYLGVLVSDSGGGPLSLGFAYFFDSTPELISFFLTSRLLRKYHSKNLIFAAIILQIARLLLILVFSSSLAIILMGTLSGLAYGLIAAVYKTYIYELAPEKYKVSCLGLGESVIGLSGVVSAPFFGFMIINFGTYASIAVGLAIGTAAALILAGNIFKKSGRQGENHGITNNMEPPLKQLKK